MSDFRDEIAALINEAADLKVEERRIQARLAEIVDRLSAAQFTPRPHQSETRQPSAPAIRPETQERRAPMSLPKIGTEGRRYLDSLRALGGHASHALVASRAYGVDRPTPEMTRKVRAMMASFKVRGLIVPGDRDGFTRLTAAAQAELERDVAELELRAPSLADLERDGVSGSEH